jgi:hypothetical protein
LLCGIWNHLVIADLKIPAGLGLPGRLGDRAAKGASMPHGTWESLMKAAVFGSTSPAKEAGNLALSRNK